MIALICVKNFLFTSLYYKDSRSDKRIHRMNPISDSIIDRINPTPIRLLIGRLNRLFINKISAYSENIISWLHYDHIHYAYFFKGVRTQLSSFVSHN